MSWHLAELLQQVEDEQFQLLTAYANYCVGSEFDTPYRGAATRGVAERGSTTACAGLLPSRACGCDRNIDIDAELSRHDTTENASSRIRPKLPSDPWEAKR